EEEGGMAICNQLTRKMTAFWKGSTRFGVLAVIEVPERLKNTAARRKGERRAVFLSLGSLRAAIVFSNRSNRYFFRGTSRRLRCVSEREAFRRCSASGCARSAH